MTRVQHGGCSGPTVRVQHGGCSGPTVRDGHDCAVSSVECDQRATTTTSGASHRARIAHCGLGTWYVCTSTSRPNSRRTRYGPIGSQHASTLEGGQALVPLSSRPTTPPTSRRANSPLSLSSAQAAACMSHPNVVAAPSRPCLPVWACTRRCWVRLTCGKVDSRRDGSGCASARLRRQGCSAGAAHIGLHCFEAKAVWTQR